MGAIIGLILGNFGLFMLILSVIIILVNSSMRKKISFAEITFRWLTLLPLGVTAIYAFLMHILFPNFTAATIGWQSSPFQFEVGMANLGFGVIALLSFKASYGFRLANVIGNTCWLWGDSIGHIIQMIRHHHYTIGNAGSWFWLDILVPFLLIVTITIIGRTGYPARRYTAV